MSRILPTLAFVAVTGAAAACRTLPPPAPQVAWSYAGEAGPEAWARLSPDFRACADGRAQSPIDLAGAAAVDVADPRFAYGQPARQLVNGDHGFEVRFEPGNRLELDGTSWELVQMHLHAPSEHAIDGRRFPAEAHLVHRDAAGRLAVVGVLLDAAAPGTTPRPWPLPVELPPAPGAVAELAPPLDAAALLPAGHRSYSYDGSLTTPPCSEGVRWTVMADPVAVDAARLEALAATLHGNSRPLQPRRERPLVLDGAD